MNYPIRPLLLLVLCLGSVPTLCWAEEEIQVPFEFESGESSLLVGPPHPALLLDFKVEGYDYLEAAVSVEDEGASVTWAPFLVPRGNKRRYTFWRETRFELRQKDDVTSFGVSLKYNPLNPLSDNGEDAWKRYWEEERKKKSAALDPDPQELTTAWRLRKVDLTNQERCELSPVAKQCCTGLIAQVVASTPRNDGDSCLLVGLDLAIKDLEREVGKLEIDPQNPDRVLLKSKKEQLGRARKAFSGLLVAAEQAYFKQVDRTDTSHLMVIRSESAELDRVIEKSITSHAAAHYLGYREALYARRKPIINLSYIHSFFNVLSGGEVDDDSDDLNDNEHRTKARSLALSADWQLGENDGLSLIATRSMERSSAEEDTPLADYNGFGATWSHVLTVLNRKGYKKSKEYRESLFVPSIIFGIAYETKECDAPNADCADGILRTQALTPFLDFKIKKSAQFRIGIPFKRNRIFREGGEMDEDSIDIVSLVALQLGAPK